MKLIEITIKLNIEGKLIKPFFFLIKKLIKLDRNYHQDSIEFFRSVSRNFFLIKTDKYNTVCLCPIVWLLLNMTLSMYEWKNNRHKKEKEKKKSRGTEVT